MKLLLKFILYTLLATVFVTQATDHAVIQEYLIYFFALGSFVVFGFELIELEEKGEL